MDVVDQELIDSVPTLQMLSKVYPTVACSTTELINLTAILHLPKATEHFLSDLHGEYEQFDHVLRNGSGNVRRKIQELFGNQMMESEMNALAMLIYYPELKLKELLKEESEKNVDEFYRILIFRLVALCRDTSSKYTRSKVRKSLPKEFSYVMEELLHEQESSRDKQHYYRAIIQTIISSNRDYDFVVAMCYLIQRLIIDHLHILGDLYDRGPAAHLILKRLKRYHSLDIQWGNHDVLWMGAAMGHLACICNVIRISLRYSNLSTLEDGYGITMFHLASFASSKYRNDPCSLFQVKGISPHKNKKLLAQMQKAIYIMQLKVEAMLMVGHPEFDMNDRMMLDKIDFEKGTITLDGVVHELLDKCFPTIDPANPTKLSDEEEFVLERLSESFRNSDSLQDDARFLFSKGSLYLIYNKNLLFHGCIPMNPEGEFQELVLDGHRLSGKELLNYLDKIVRRSFFSDDPVFWKRGTDFLWYLWMGKYSPLFGKDKMATFERSFISDTKTHEERQNQYFKLRDDIDTVDKILRNFGLDPDEDCHIINGHVPVKVKKGESPIKAGKKLLVIDGGFSRAYQSVTGIAGYTLICNSHGLLLCSHKPFKSISDAVIHDNDIDTSAMVINPEYSERRLLIKDTDIGKSLEKEKRCLELLVKAYQEGYLKER